MFIMEEYMSKFEKKFGKYAISNLTLVLILCYVVGYVIQIINNNFFQETYKKIFKNIKKESGKLAKLIKLFNKIFDFKNKNY